MWNNINEGAWRELWPLWNTDHSFQRQVSTRGKAILWPKFYKNKTVTSPYIRGNTQKKIPPSIRQAAASQLLVYKPAAWDHWCTDRSEQHTAVTIRYSQGDLKQASPSPRSHLEQEGMAVQPQHCSTRDTPNIPCAAEEREEHCRGGSGTHCLQPKRWASPGLLLHCGGVARDAKPRKKHRDKFAKNDPHRFPTLFKATILQINNGVWGQMACYIRATNFYAVRPFIDRNPFKQGSWMQVIDFF